MIEKGFSKKLSINKNRGIRWLKERQKEKLEQSKAEYSNYYLMDEACY